MSEGLTENKCSQWNHKVCGGCTDQAEGICDGLCDVCKQPITAGVILVFGKRFHPGCRDTINDREYWDRYEKELINKNGPEQVKEMKTNSEIAHLLFGKTAPWE